MLADPLFSARIVSKKRERTGLVQHSAHGGSSHGAQRQNLSPPVILALSISYSSGRRGGGASLIYPWRLVNYYHYYSECIEWCIETQVFSPSYDSAPPHPPPPLPVSKIDRRHTGRVRKRYNLLAGRGGGGAKHRTARRERMVLL